MLEKGKITQIQLFTLVFMFVIGTSILYVPFLMATAAKQDAWIATLIGICFGLLLTCIYGSLAKRYPDLTLMQMNEKILGKWAGKGLSLLFFIYFLTLTSGLIRMIGDFITTHIMPETPIQAIEIIFMLIVVYGARLGLETFSRTAEMVLPWIILFFFLLVFFLLPEIQIENIFPLLEGGIKPVLKASFLSLGVPFSDIVIFLMITPYISPPGNFGKVLFIATLTGGVILFVIVFMAILVLGPSQVAQLNYPIYVLAQKVNIGNFIQRIEILAGGMVFISIFIKTVISFYSLSLGLAQILNLKEFKMLSFPFGIIVIFVGNIMSPNLVYFQTFLLKSWSPIVSIYGLIIPLLLLGIDVVRKGFMKRKNQLSESK